MEGIRVGNKISKYPIIQGGMGVGVSMHNLAGNVSKEGGICIISTADFGYQEEDFVKNPMKANLRAIGKEIKKAREIALISWTLKLPKTSKSIASLQSGDVPEMTDEKYSACCCASSTLLAVKKW